MNQAKIILYENHIKYRLKTFFVLAKMQHAQQNNQGPPMQPPMQRPQQLPPGLKRTRINLTNVKQLIDINDHSTNFEATFRVISENKQPFQALVVNQTTLDNNPNLAYKEVNDGQFSGSVSENSGIYQNYFIVLKAETPCVCDVEIVKKELPNTPPPISRLSHTHEKPKTVNWGLVVLVVGGLALAGFLGYIFLIKNGKSDKKPVIRSNNVSNFRFPSRPPVNYRRESPAPSASPVRNNPLLDKLRNINF